MSNQQFRHWLTCQRCGAVAPRGTKDWMNVRRKWRQLKGGGHVPDHSGIRIVRCPAHWSDWALRCAGRRHEPWMTKMKKLQNRYRNTVLPNPYLSPYPLTDTPPVQNVSSQLRRI